MAGFRALFARELAAYFATPVGWIALTAFLLVQGYSFYGLLALSLSSEVVAGPPMQLFFGGTLLYWLVMLIVCTALTMRLIAGEGVRGTLELVLAAPVDEATVIASKYAAALCCFVLLWLPTGVYVGVVALVGGGSVDLGPIASGYLGTLFVGGSCLALGLLCSTLASSQMAAAMATFALLSILMLASLARVILDDPQLVALVSRISFAEQMNDFSRGIVDTRHIVFNASLSIFALAGASWSLRGRRWR